MRPPVASDAPDPGRAAPWRGALATVAIPASRMPPLGSMERMPNSATDPDVGRALVALARTAGDPRACEHKRGYLRHLPMGTVVDIGCGEGVLLDVARASGRRVLGIDSDAAAVDMARGRGHEVLHGDALELLQQLARQGVLWDGAVLAHVVEHHEPARALALLRAIAAILRPGGVLVLATPNCANYIVQSELFWLDPTHLRPYPRLLVERLADQAGFVVVESYLDPATRPVRSWWRAALAQVRSWLSGVDKSSPLDLVVVGRRR